MADEKNEKQNRIQKLQNEFTHPQSEYVRTFAILTYENSISLEKSESKSAELQKQFTKDLKDSQFIFHPIRGKYGKPEHSYIVLNVTITDMDYFARNRKLQSYIFAKKTDNIWEYECLQINENGDYETIYKKNNVERDDIFDDFLSKITGFKFRSSFFDYLKKSFAHLDGIYTKNKIPENEIQNSLDEEKIPRFRYYARGFILHRPLPQINNLKITQLLEATHQC